MINTKKANHEVLVLFIVAMFIGVFIFSALIEYGTSLIDDSDNMKDKYNNKFSQDFEIISVYVFGTEDNEINGGIDNFTVIARLGPDAVDVPLSEIKVELQSEGIAKKFIFGPGTTLTPTTYTYDYSFQGENYKPDYISKGDVLAFNIRLPSGYTIYEGEYLRINFIYLKKNTNVPIMFTLPDTLTEHKTYLYP